MLTPQQTIALKSIAAASVIAEHATGCPSALSAAQAILESGWLQHCPGNNCFGIKATDSHENYTLTQEFVAGQYVTEKLAFEAYPTLADCFTAHARLIQGGPYSDAWRAYEEDRNLNELIQGIAHIYATAPNYATQVYSLAHSTTVLAAIAQARGSSVS